MSIQVRDLTRQDEPRWRELWAGYVAFYQADVSDEITDYTWDRLMDPASPVFGLVALDAGHVVGIVNCVLHENTWALDPVCYLEDLFVDDSLRGRGAGRALMDQVIARAKERGWHRVYWMTLHDNSTARALYDKIAPVTDWVRYDA